MSGSGVLTSVSNWSIVGPSRSARKGDFGGGSERECQSDRTATPGADSTSRGNATGANSAGNGSCDASRRARNREDVALDFAENALGDTAEQRPSKPRAAMCADHEEVWPKAFD